MKKESTALYILRLTATLLAICAVVALALAGVNAITRDRIAAVKAEKTQNAIAAVLPGVAGLEPVEVAAAQTVTNAYRSGNSFAVEVTPSGFGGDITMMVGITDGKVVGISIISHAETPGLGAVAAANNDKGAAFRDQFVGLAAGITLGDGENQVDSISGATISSQAIIDGVNAALEYVAKFG